jgi:hypothetical protein
MLSTARSATGEPVVYERQKPGDEPLFTITAANMAEHEA